MKYRTGFLVGAALIGVSLTALPAMAAPRPAGPFMAGPGAPVWGGPAMLEGIDLTKQQQKKIQTILQQAGDQDQTDTIRDDLGRVRRQIQDILSEPGQLDRPKIQALLQQQATLRAEQEARHLDVAEQIHDVLTPEQLSAIKARQAKIRDLMDQLREVQHPVPQASSN